MTGDRAGTGVRLPGDVELVVSSVPERHGFAGTSRQGRKVTVVFEKGLSEVFGPFREGEKLRVLRGVSVERGLTLELRGWSEVFHVDRREPH